MEKSFNFNYFHEREFFYLKLVIRAGDEVSLTNILEIEKI